MAQRVTLTSNQIDLAWSGGTTPGYRLLVGSSAGNSDIGSIDTTQTSYTFVAPRTANTYYARVVGISGAASSAASRELTITTLDLRSVIDALFFRAGPLSPGKAVQLGSIQAGVWPDGTHLRVLVSREAGESRRAEAQAAVDDYASTVDGAITGTAELVDDDLHSLVLSQVPPFTIAIRVIPGFCGASALGCESGGPAPIGPNSSIVTLHSPSLTSVAAHELGHAYGLFHITGAPVGALFGSFLMNPTATADITMSPAEKAAIGAGHAGGIRAGTTRDQALASGLVLPYAIGAVR